MNLRKQTLNRLHLRLADARQLLDIHTALTGDARGRRYDVDALNRGAVILSVAAWEGYIEDLALLNAKAFSLGLPGPSKLPVISRDPFLVWLHATQDFRQPTDAVREAMWSITGRGWRVRFREYATEKVGALNTPNANNVRKLFKAVLGLEDITESWGYRRWGAEVYRAKLDDLLTLRHRIAHGSIGSEMVRKTRARDGIKLVSALGERSYQAVGNHFTTHNISFRRTRRRQA